MRASQQGMWSNSIGAGRPTRSCRPGWTVICALFFIVSIQVCTVEVRAQAIAQFRGDAAHTGVYTGPAPKEISHIAWEFKTGGRVFSSPVVADGLVFVGSNDHFLHAIDAATGHEQWKFATAANVNSSPAVAKGAVYVLSLDGNAYAVEEHSGKLLW